MVFHVLRKVFCHQDTPRVPHWRVLFIYLMLVCVFVSTLVINVSKVEVQGQLVGEVGSLCTLYMLGMELRPSFRASITSTNHYIWLLTCALGLNTSPHLAEQTLYRMSYCPCPVTV